jgi:hypothetical protein
VISGKKISVQTRPFAVSSEKLLRMFVIRWGEETVF